MKKSYRFFKILAFITLFLLPAFTFAGWFKVHEDPSFEKINAAVSYGYNFKEVYAVGNGGWLYITPDQGHNWSSVSLVSGKNLYGVDLGSAVGQNDNYLSIVGQNGTIIRYDVNTQEWSAADTVTSKDLLNVHFNYYRNEFWAVGDSNFMAYSPDAGLSWSLFDMGQPLMKIHDFVFTYEKTAIVGDDSQNVYIQMFRSNPDSTVQPIRLITLNDRRLIAVAHPLSEYDDNLYFLAKSTTTGETFLMKMDMYNSQAEPEQLSVLTFPNPMSLGIYYDYDSESESFWVGTSDGQIYEAVNRLNLWMLDYKDDHSLGIQTFLAGEDNSMRGMAFGEQGLTLLNGFQVTAFEPLPQQIVLGARNDFKVRFSDPPDLHSLQNVFVKSNLSGNLSLNAYYDPMDSNFADFKIGREFPANGIAGEKWEIAFGPGIHANADTNNQVNLKQFSYALSFAQQRAAPFNYELGKLLPHVPAPSTNWVAGFFNKDDMIDLITFASDTLYCFYQQRTLDSIQILVSKIPLQRLITVESSIKRQLLLADVNQDGLPDLILFDNASIQMLINQSNDSEIVFRLANASYSGDHLRQVVPFNDNNNNQTDLLVLSNNLKVFDDISPSQIGNLWYSVLSTATNINKVAVGDLDGDNGVDLVLLENGTLLFRRGAPENGLSGWNEVDTLVAGNYTDFNLGNIDNAGPLEIVALAPDGIDIVPIFGNALVGPKIMSTTPTTIIHFNSTEPPVKDFALQDFGGDPSTDINNPLDIGLLRGDSLIIYQNITPAQGEITFDQQPAFTMHLPDAFNLMLPCEFNGDQTVNIVATNTETGMAQVLNKPLWKPQLTLKDFDAYHVTLEWAPPTGEGQVSVYHIIKYWKGDSNKFTILTTQATTYTDNDVWPFNDYSYKLKALFDNGVESDFSNLIYVKTYFDFSGNQQGVIADTTLPYWVKKDLVVPQTDSLRLDAGIKMAFSDSAGFYVYGKLHVAGNVEHIVNFEEKDSTWNGIQLFSNTDTVHFEWFSINGANIAIQSEGRPFKLHGGGIGSNKVGILAKNTDFYLKNIVIDSTINGLEVEENSNAHLKNIDVLNALNHSIFVQGTDAKVWISNAIIWNNAQPIMAKDPAKIWINYSTVDSIGSRVVAKHISWLPPVFNFTDPDMPFKIDYKSPTIDAGDPLDDFSFEPMPNGGRVNQGALGNTIFASPSLQPRILVTAQKLPLHAFADQLDSTILFIKNWGYAPLTVANIGLKISNASGPFLLEKSQVPQVQAGDSAALKIWFKAPKHGTYQDTLLVGCNDPHLINGTYLFYLEGIGLNSLPHITNEPASEAFVDSQYVFKPIPADADGDSVLIEPIAKPGWLRWEHGILSGTPALVDTGSAEVKLRMDDQFGGIDTLMFNILVKANKPPIINSPIIKITAKKLPLRAFANQLDSTFLFIKNFGNALLSVDSIGLKISNASGPFLLEKSPVPQVQAGDSAALKIWFKPPKHGTYFDTLLVNCNDLHLINGTYSFYLEGIGLNSLPHITNEPASEAFVDSQYVFKPIPADADGDSVLIKPIAKPEWLHWKQGILSGTPALGDTGIAEVKLRMNDQFGGIDTLSFSILVKAIKITPLIKITAMDGLLSHQAAIRFQISVRDSILEGDRLKEVKDATNSYHFKGIVRNLQSHEYSAFSRVGVNRLEFKNLKDGTYRFKLRVEKSVIGLHLLATDSITFIIKASIYSINRFRWNMVSIPRSIDIPWDSLHFADSSAVLFRWDPKEEKYKLLNRQNIIGGWGYWIMPIKNLTFNVNRIPIEATTPNAAMVVNLDFPGSISLKSGWNQVGLSLPYYERWLDLKVTNEQSEEISWNRVLKDSLIMPAVYWFEQSQEFQGYHVEEIDSNSFGIPWRGYWMFSKENLTLTLPDSPYFPGAMITVGKKTSALVIKNPNNEWMLNFTLSSENYRDNYNVLGISENRPGSLPEPPYFNHYAALTFVEHGKQFCKVIKKDPDQNDAVLSWNVTVNTTSPQKTHYLQWEKIGSNNDQIYAYLVDLETETVINMSEKTNYSFTPDKPQYKFKVYASRDNHFKPSIIPLEYKLAQNFPNPFNPTTTITIGIPETGKNDQVVLKIYDVLGKEVETLYQGNLEPGYHKFEWNGCNRSGNPVSSGIYFYQLQAGGKSIMRKMILLR